MGKNKHSKDEAPGPSNVANREIFQRLNFLYQASAYLKGIEVPTTAQNHNQEDSGARKKGKRRKAGLGDLGSSYVQCMRIIGNKSVVRMDPTVKRTLCKGCDTVLLPGTTASVRVKGSPGKGLHVTYTCLACHTSRIIPAPPVALSAPIPSCSPPIVDTQELSTPGPVERAKKQKMLVSRPLPLFARQDAGHVVFRGNEVLRES